MDIIPINFNFNFNNNSPQPQIQSQPPPEPPKQEIKKKATQKCSCSKIVNNSHCTGACGCRKNGNVCSSLCKCKGVCNNSSGNDVLFFKVFRNVVIKKEIYSSFRNKSSTTSTTPVKPPPKVKIGIREKRKNQLIEALGNKGLKLRGDSTLCDAFIRGKCRYDIDEVVEEMCLMKYLHEYIDLDEYFEIAKRYHRHGEGPLFEEAKRLALKDNDIPYGNWPWLNDDDSDSDDN